ncbi:hypothetical protein [Larkinella soli]|uniref:hypothetical protein n=1 Tax=Larkinella soli TaxID=1770527 RepID=UPI000FFC635B|nr:hypothetical protein [Larkinella soli]
MRLTVRIALFLLIPPLAFYSVFPQVFRCQTIRFSDDFRKVGARLWVDQGANAGQRDRLRNEIDQASRRLETLWQDSLRGNAEFIYCLSPAQYERYCPGTEGAGCSIGTPWGDSWIVVNPFGRNPDVLAHEMCHNELFTRLGWLTTQRQIPQWFNEGLALMVDYRFAADTDSLHRYEEFRDQWEYHTRGRQFVLELEEIESLRGFFEGGPSRVVLSYSTAGMEVSRWLATVGRQGLAELVKGLDNGENFEELYRTIESRAKKRPRLPTL